MYQYILFDLDGTLTDPKEGICKSVQHALRSFGIEEDNLDRLEPFIGPPLKDSFMERYTMTEEEAERAIAKYRERFSTIGLYENVVYPGIAKMLGELTKAGKHLAVASSKPTVFVEKILKYFSLDGFFEVVVGSELDGTRVRKEEVVKEALHRLIPEGFEAQKDSIVMVGDRSFDVQGARQFGLASVGVTYGYGGEEELIEAGATITADTVRELTRVLMQAPGKKKKAAEHKDQDEATEAGLVRAMRKADERGVVPSSPYKMLWLVLRPVLFYYLGAGVFLFFLIYGMDAIPYVANEEVGEWILNHRDLLLVCLNAVGMLVGYLLVRREFLSEVGLGGSPLVIRPSKVFRTWWREGARANRKDPSPILFGVILGITASLFLNLSLAMVNFTKISESYTKTEATQYSAPLWLGLILYGIVSPWAEEVLFRGILYRRMKRFYSVPVAMIFTSLLFGGMHLNLVQGIYGTVMGLLMALLYEKTKRFSATLAFHIAANVSIFTLSKFGILAVMGAYPFSVLVFAGLTLAGLLLLYRQS